MSRNAIFNSISFRPTTAGSSNSPGVSFAPSIDGPAQPNMSFFGVSDFYNSVRSDWNKTEAKVAANAIKGSPSSAISTGSAAASAGVSTGLSAASAPLGMAAYVSQQIGQGITQIQSANTEQTIQDDYAKNQQAHGTNVGVNSNIIRSQAEAVRGRAEAGGMIGSLFGPIGALIGHAVGGAVSSNPDLLKTAVGTFGQVNPSDTGIANSASLAAPSGVSTLQDNVAGTVN
uniref:Uncharacterized protein n=1 Tax=Electric ant polycipivirus 2 TaxID=3003606 RepID=A0AA95E580_9VIRU|nr:hypothetical protein [Electric ant polycipivirus 2]